MPEKAREFNMTKFKRMVVEQVQDKNLSQKQIESQFDICSLYCVFAF